ncbi:Phage protein Gp37/Gp68 domain protein [Leptospira interrogans serovar Canicola]|nr:Phage protein Gp37/Gp68 domain protein [Leptospira interrogans serovar Canicola]
MGAKSNIEWTEATWNPVTGCTKISAGCANCYAEVLTRRFEKDWGKFRSKDSSISFIDTSKKEKSYNFFCKFYE